jgi:hypothetical protein
MSLAHPQPAVHGRVAMRALAVTLLCSFLLACSEAKTPVASTEAAFPAVLTIDSRGGPPIIVKAGSIELARVPCSGGAVVTPGDPGVPELPWQLTVVKQSDGKVLLTSLVTALPQWLVLFGEDAGIGNTPVLGPSGPPCPGSP